MDDRVKNEETFEQLLEQSRLIGAAEAQNRLICTDKKYYGKQKKKVGDNRVEPQFTKELEATKAKEGMKKVALRVEFSGIPAPEVMWHKDGFLLQSSLDFMIESTATSSTLTIKEAFISDTGVYQVKLLNEVGVAQTKAYLNVTASKSFSLKNLNLSLTN